MSKYVIPLSCPVQKYAWGKLGSNSSVAKLQSSAHDPPLPIKEDEPYAELWMGTHRNAPSKLLADDTLLEDYIKGGLPYLFKVLSVNKALSIQAHPHKTLAEKLHSERPNVYKDDNHKPEMACAVTEFQALCGFRPPEQIATALKTVAEFKTVVGDAAASDFITAVDEKKCGDELKPFLKAVFTNVMECKAETLAPQIKSLIDRLTNTHGADADPMTDRDGRNLNVEKLIVRLSKQYPGDVGVFAPFLLNAFVLQPGEAIFLAANEPHAYLDGDCVECMACSDNVVRAGLTPKLRDTPVLCSMLTYKAMYPTVLTGDAINESTRTYTPPVQEFALARTELKAAASAKLAASAGESIILCYEGSCTLNGIAARKGSVLLVRQGEEVTVTAGEQGALLFRCSENK